MVINKRLENMGTDKPFYSVLSYNVGGYEKIHPVFKKSSRAEYVYVTDDRSIVSDDWKVVYVDNPHPEDPFYLCYQIRFNPFDYVSNDIVVRIDGSMSVTGDLDEIIDAFDLGGYDCCVEAHPSRQTMIEEYSAWVQVRGYDVEQAKKCLGFLQYMEGYDCKGYRGLYQYNFMIQRRNDMNLKWNELTLALLRYLAPEGKKIDRLDQTIGSFVLNKYFNGCRVMVVLADICDGSILSWYAHNTETQMGGFVQQCVPYLFNEPAQIQYFNIGKGEENIFK